MKVKRGNTIAFIFEVKDADGILVDNLGNADSVCFMVKKGKTDLNEDAIITKTLDDGITVDSPDEGKVKVQLTKDDLNIEPGQYYFALEIIWGDSRQEINIKENDLTLDRFTVEQDIIF